MDKRAHVRSAEEMAQLRELLACPLENLFERMQLHTLQHVAGTCAPSDKIGLVASPDVFSSQ